MPSSTLEPAEACTGFVIANKTPKSVDIST